MPTYKCEIALEIDAPTGEEAVREAESQLDNPANRGFVWTVTDIDSPLSPRDIDAMKLPLKGLDE